MLSPAQAAYNLGLTSQDALKTLVECTVGISDAGLDKLHTLRDLDSHYLVAMEARRVPGAKSAFSKLVDTSYLSGQRWLWDVSPAFSDGFDGFVYYIIFICRVSLFIRIYPVRDKSAQTFITCALEPLRVFVQTVLPDTRLLSIHGDSDAAVSQWGVKIKIIERSRHTLRIWRRYPHPHHAFSGKHPLDE